MILSFTRGDLKVSITSIRMKERRKQLGLKADDIAEKLGVSRATIFRYENGDIEKVPFNALAPLAVALQTNIAYLAGWTDEPDVLNLPLDETMISPEMRAIYENNSISRQRLLLKVSSIPEEKVDLILDIIGVLEKYWKNN